MGEALRHRRPWPERRSWLLWYPIPRSLLLSRFCISDHLLIAGQDIYFYQNYPIRFVSITGVILSIEDKFSKYTLLELDDGSGKLITVKITRLAKDVTQSIDCPSNTTVSNVNIITAIGRYDVLVDLVPLDIGTVIKIKATISVFRNMKQLELKRVRIVRSTAEELVEWEELAKCKRDLDRPWILSKERLKELEKAETEKRRMRRQTEVRAEERQKSEANRKIKRAEKRREYEESKERQRRKEELIMNLGALI